MTTIKLLSAGLIAIAMLTNSAVAHENSATERSVVRTVNASDAATGFWMHSRARIQASHGGDTSPRKEAGGVCDAGDDPMIC